MAKVKSLKIQPQSGADGTVYATWAFDSTVKKVTSKVKVGSWVNVKSGSKWYNGTTPSSFVFTSGPWKVIQVSGQRAVINENRAGTYKIMSPINVTCLTVEGGGEASVTENTVDNYEVTWQYDSGDGVWFEGSESTVETKNATYRYPDNALRVRVLVKPVAKKREVNGKDTPYWTGSSVSSTYNLAASPPEQCPSPEVSVDGFQLTATVDNVSDPRTDEVQFQVYDVATPFATATATVSACMASATFRVNAGGRYRVRARSVNIYGTGRVYGDWTDFTDATSTIPVPPGSAPTLRATSSTSIRADWPVAQSAETYDLEWATSADDFDVTSDTTVVNGIGQNSWELTGLESGSDYYVRVRSVNDVGSSSWTKPSGVTIGTVPGAPTTWSSTTTAMVGEDVSLRWAHSPTDGSDETYAQVEITIDGVKDTYTVAAETGIETGLYVLETDDLTEGAEVVWRVRTAGVTREFGPWSAARTVDVYAPPTLSLTLTDQSGASQQVVTGLPVFLGGEAGPSTQAPVGYHVSITADEGYVTVDEVGRTVNVAAGDSVYSEWVDTSDDLLLRLGPDNISLEDGIGYTATVAASMDSGLTASAELGFSVSWEDQEYELDCEIVVDESTWTAYVTPWARDADGAAADDVLLAVWRRDADGGFTEIASGIDPTSDTVAVDPHPALDYARYRITATSKTTGSVSWYDAPGMPVGCISVVIQWDEQWQDYDVGDPDDTTVSPQWAGSMLELPYDIQVDESSDGDVALVGYIGRSHPVSYHGTQSGIEASWSVDLVKGDAETLAALRRLQAWRGDVYVREPTGSGYWAVVDVSVSQTADSAKVPVKLDVTRVEGGV